MTLRAISAHRDVYPTSCPGASLYGQLAAIRAAVAQTGLPKLYSPAVVGTLGGPIRFTARLSGQPSWTVTVRDQKKVVIASNAGIGASVDWTWDSTAAAHRALHLDDQRAADALGYGHHRHRACAARAAAAEGRAWSGDPERRRTRRRGEGWLRISVPALVTASVLDSLGDTVATLFGQRRPAGQSEYVWSDVGLPDGRYRLSLVAKDDRGKQVQSTVPLYVDRTLAGFVASAPAISPNGDGRFDTIGYSSSSRSASRGCGSCAAVRGGHADLGSAGRRAAAVTWDGSGLPDGEYSAVVSATDSLLDGQAH